MAQRIQLNFTGGELSPALAASTDLTKYQSGLRKCRNCYIGRAGGVMNRAGTEYVGEVKDNSAKARLVPFVSNSESGIALVFNGDVIIAYKDGKIFELDDNEKNELIYPFEEENLPELRYDSIFDVMTLTHLSKSVKEIKKESETKLTIQDYETLESKVVLNTAFGIARFIGFDGTRWRH